jgi:cellulose biosynthesis protein BcsQ
MDGSSPLGRVVTFYSYKGGTGRTMALANVAWTLAANGLRVLVIDWDLEAPGLHRYFRPYLLDPELKASDGLIDFMLAFADAAARQPEDGQADGPEWFEAQADLRMYAYAVDAEPLSERGGCLDFVPAGRQDAGYSVRVNSFNWQHFYSKLGGGIFLEAVKRRLRSEYDYVLIDSRTGVSDTSGVCTVQMPDTLVVCFTLNEQSIRGAASTAASALEQRHVQGREDTLRVMPVPTRVDSSEKERVDAARMAARDQFDGVLGWLDDDQLDAYWGDVEVPYIPFYSLEEVLAVFDLPRARNSLLPAMEGLVSWISEQQVIELPRMSEDVRHAEQAKFLRARGPSVGARQSPRSIYISHSEMSSDESLQAFVNDLVAEVSVLTGVPADEVAYFDGAHRAIGDDPRATYRVEQAHVVVSIVSPAYAGSKWTAGELDMALRAGVPVIAVPWVPLRETGSSLFEQTSAIQLPQEARGSLRHLLRQNRSTYETAVYDLAEAIVRKLPPRIERRPVQNEAPRIVVPIVAERARSMRNAPPGRYGLRRRDWAPFDGRSAGAIVTELASSLGVPAQLVSLHKFEQWIREGACGAALVLIDAMSAEREDHDALLTEWSRRPIRSETIVVSSADRMREIETRYRARAPDGIQTHLRFVSDNQDLETAIAAALLRLRGVLVNGTVTSSP